MIQQLRQRLATDLSALGVPVHTPWPDRLTPPCALVVPPASGFYLTPGPNFGGEYTISVDVVLLVAKGTSDVALTDLETLIEVTLINSADWALSGVDTPASVTVGTQELLGTVIHLSAPGTL